jgi:hypothetical protein
MEKRSFSIQPYRRGDKTALHITPLPCLLRSSIFMLLQTLFSAFHMMRKHFARTQLRSGDGASVACLLSLSMP